MLEEKEKKGKWFVIKVHTGFEELAKAGIEQMIESQDLGDKIFEALIPVEKRVYIKKGKRVEKEVRMYPGYVLIHMIMDKQARHAIGNVKYVSQFLGGSRSVPESLSQEEIDTIKRRLHKDVAQDDKGGYMVGDTVKVIEGPFANLDGRISEVDGNKGQVTVLVPMFGRETPIKLDMFQIQSL